MPDKLPINLSGTTEHFKGNGRKLGYPTANIRSSTSLSDGVYFGYGDLGPYNHQPALIFVGVPVTVGDTERRVEAHLLGIIDKDYYGQEIRLSVQHFHRQNERFASVDALLVVMKTDEVTAGAWFKNQELLASAQALPDT